MEGLGAQGGGAEWGDGGAWQGGRRDAVKKVKFLIIHINLSWRFADAGLGQNNPPDQDSKQRTKQLLTLNIFLQTGRLSKRRKSLDTLYVNHLETFLTVYFNMYIDYMTS